MSPRRASSSWSGSVISFVLTRARRSSRRSRGHADADVGPQQRLLEVVPRLVGDALATADAGERADERRAGPRHALAQGGRGDGLRLDDLGFQDLGFQDLGLEDRGARRTDLGGCGRRSRTRRRRRVDRPRRAPAVDDEHADPEQDDEPDEDEVDPLHRRATLPARRRAVAEPARAAGKEGQPAGSGDALGDHLRGPTRLHRHAEQAVAGLHRALLVADDEQLRLAAELGEQRRGSGAG